ncbi:MAG: cupredoxin domain-containing protein [Pseudonocardia sp.]
MTRVARTTASRLLAVLATALAVLLVAMGCSGSTTTAGGGGSTIVIKDFAFTPADITVAPGTKIMVTNSDSAIHTVTANDKSFDTGSITNGQTVELTAPTAPGKYPFRCTPHQYMTGTLTVA